jgi:hypothetical protein
VLSESRIVDVTIDLQDVAESCEMLGLPRMLNAGACGPGAAQPKAIIRKPLDNTQRRTLTSTVQAFVEHFN